ncbi:MAG: type I-E CRISPR-associated protein Cas5/CasD [Gammaproteobacteria bacterium]|nr:type I-E CRISPR-associated protein Cas5/CasD [Gammaproteobacteria bacterium]
MEYLVIRLAAPMSSWGEPAVGEFRPSAAWPGDSSLVGLLGAAFGIDRLDIDAQHALRDSLRFAVGVLSAGDLLRDYHTAQVPGRSAPKGRPHRTRRDELLVTKSDLNTVLSTREYRQNGDWLVAIAATAASRWRLSEVASALQRPKFVLYLGRKSCPPAAPSHLELSMPRTSCRLSGSTLRAMICLQSSAVSYGAMGSMLVSRLTSARHARIG